MMKYSQKVIEHFMNPRNVGELPDADVKATEGSMACGDMVTLWLKVNPKTLVIEKITFKSYGCASNIATCSVLTEMVKGKTLEEAKKITFKQLVDELEGLPLIKFHCAVLAVDTLKSAIRLYEEQHGLVKELVVDEHLIRSRLRRVLHPNWGKDIITLRMVKGFKLKDGVIELDLVFKKDDPFKDHVLEELDEKLGHLPGYKLKLNIREADKLVNLRLEQERLQNE